MADKITEDTIKKLIEQVMKEGQLNEFKVDITGTSSKWKKKIFGKSTGVPTKPDVAAVADFDGDGKNLQIDDFEIGFSSQKGDKMNSKYRTGWWIHTKKTLKTSKMISKLREERRNHPAEELLLIRPTLKLAPQHKQIRV
jgi:hypothetical protein